MRLDHLLFRESKRKLLWYLCLALTVTNPEAMKSVHRTDDILFRRGNEARPSPRANSPRSGQAGSTLVILLRPPFDKIREFKGGLGTPVSSHAGPPSPSPLGKGNRGAAWWAISSAVERAPDNCAVAPGLWKLLYTRVVKCDHRRLTRRCV